MKIDTKIISRWNIGDKLWSYQLTKIGTREYKPKCFTIEKIRVEINIPGEKEDHKIYYLISGVGYFQEEGDMSETSFKTKKEATMYIKELLSIQRDRTIKDELSRIDSAKKKLKNIGYEL